MDATFPLIQVPYPHPTRPGYQVRVKLWHRGVFPVGSPRLLIRKLAGRSHFYLPEGVWTLGGQIQPAVAVVPVGVQVEVDGIDGAVRVGTGAPGEPVLDALTLIAPASGLAFDREAITLLLDAAGHLPIIQQVIRHKPGPPPQLDEHIATLRRAYLAYRQEGMPARTITHHHAAYRAERAAQGSDRALNTQDTAEVTYARKLAKNSRTRMAGTPHSWKQLRAKWEAEHAEQLTRTKHQ